MKKILRIFFLFCCSIYMLGCGSIENNKNNDSLSDSNNIIVEENKDVTSDTQDFGSEVLGESDKESQTDETDVYDASSDESSTEELVNEKKYLLTKMNLYSGDKLLEAEYYEYDEYGNEIRYEKTAYSYYDFGDYWWRQTRTSEYTYDDLDRIINKVCIQYVQDVYAEEATVSEGYESRYVYDEYGGQIEYSEKYYDTYQKIWIDNYSIKNDIEYNDNGFMTKNASVNKDGSVTSWTEWEYNEAGELIRETYYKDETVFYWTEWEYNEAGVLLKEIDYNDNGEVTTYSIYDDDGNLIETRREGVFGYYNYINKVYDLMGNCIEEINSELVIETNEKTFESKYIRRYDSNGNMINEELYVGDENRLSSKIEYEYDGNENLAKKMSYDEDGSLRFVYSYHYDNAGNIIKEEVCDDEGNLFYYYEYEYTEIIK